jgi:hypothetical protein
MYQYTKFDVHQAKGSQDIEWSVYSYVHIHPQHLDLKSNIVVIYSSWCTSVYNLKSVKQRVLKILSGQYIHMSSLTFPQNRKGSSTIKDASEYEVWNLSSKGFSRYWVVNIFLCSIRPLIFDLKINRVHLLFTMYQCMKFEVCQAKGSQDIE